MRSIYYMIISHVWMNADQCKECLTRRVMSIGDRVGWKQQGNSQHYKKRIR